jgi:hypothetical protein
LSAGTGMCVIERLTMTVIGKKEKNEPFFGSIIWVLSLSKENIQTKLF